ncbi:MAG TPA: 3-dehydroquinate synthase II [Nitrososphaeraceae archaeon]|nr:3-dehydroquinate synthase II [Nitrososphaeraceae archaeon]
MQNTKSKEIIINPMVSPANLDEFLSRLNDITIIKADPKFVQAKNFKTIFESPDADLVICKTIAEIQKLKSIGKVAGFLKRVSNNDDIDEIGRASQASADFVIVEAEDWKIIPLENVIAKLHKSNTKVYTTIKNAEETRTMFSVLELGVDGVIFSTDNEKEIDELRNYLEAFVFPIKSAKILDVRDVGTGERVCVDTTSMLQVGEGMLIGSKSNFLFLIHNESVGSSFTSPRPFRVNAGAVYCYTVMPNGKTKYLSEIEAGSEVLIVKNNGSSRRVTVGRSKIETRPLRLIRADVEGETGTIILQNAETIRFIKSDSTLLPVTDARVGDEILCYIKPPSGRHFGMEVKEFIVEK